MKSNAVIFWLVVLFVFSGAATGVLLYRMANRAQEPGSETVYDPYAMPSVGDGELTEFTLTERTGEPFNSQELDGQVYLVSFFFATCPRECAQMNRQIQVLQREFGGKGVKFVSISCDPLHDTPDVLTEYAQRFNARPGQWFFLTGNQEYIGRIGTEMFHVPVYDANMQPAHTNYLTVVDRAGRLHYFNWNEPREFAKLKTALEKFLAQTPEEARASDLEGAGEDAAQEVEGSREVEDVQGVEDIQDVEDAQEAEDVQEAEESLEASPATEDAPAVEDAATDDSASQMQRPTLPGPDGVLGTLDDVPQSPIAQVTGRQFEWRIRYAGTDGVIGTPDDFHTVNNLHLPQGEEVVLLIQSDDVLHSFLLPEMNLKQAVVPGVQEFVTFTPADSGEYGFACVELCGWGHYKMRGHMTIEPPETFLAWVEEQYASQ